MQTSKPISLPALKRIAARERERQGQLELFSRLQTGAEKPRKESARVYEAVLFLRSRGLKVWRVSSYQASVNGALVHPERIREIARQWGMK